MVSGPVIGDPLPDGCLLLSSGCLQQHDLFVNNAALTGRTDCLLPVSDGRPTSDLSHREDDSTWCFF